MSMNEDKLGEVIGGIVIDSVKACTEELQEEIKELKAKNKELRETIKQLEDKNVKELLGDLERNTIALILAEIRMLKNQGLKESHDIDWDMVLDNYGWPKKPCGGICSDRCFDRSDCSLLNAWKRKTEKVKRGQYHVRVPGKTEVDSQWGLEATKAMIRFSQKVDCLVAKNKELEEKIEKLTMAAKVLSLQDLGDITWNYSSEEFVGLYNDTPIMKYLFKVRSLYSKSDVNLNLLLDHDHLTVRACNVQEGWVEFIETEGHPIKDKDGKIILLGSPKIEGNEFVTTRVEGNVMVDILDWKGNVVVTIFKEG